ncbi:MAG: hypothetical protein WBP26_03175 [Candidatus Saccharimonadales bacterium]
MPNPEYPFSDSKIPVTDGLEGFRNFIGNYPQFMFCPYVAEKDPEGWDRSTSRVYMNQVLPNFLYVPVNIAKNDHDSLRAFFRFAQSRVDIPAINITQPHKSSPVLRELYLGDANSNTNIDTLIRSKTGQLEPYDLNSTAFVEWYKAEVGPFQDRPVILLGVGGVGEPIAKKIGVEHPQSLRLIDVSDKSELAHYIAETNQIDATYIPSLQRLTQEELPAETILINAAGKEGAANDSDLWQTIGRNTKGAVFVDIRPHLEIDVVEEAKRHGWNTYTGHGMNTRNDYVLLQDIARQRLGTIPPSFEEFQQLVAQAS